MYMLEGIRRFDDAFSWARQPKTGIAEKSRVGGLQAGRGYTPAVNLLWRFAPRYQNFEDGYRVIVKGDSAPLLSHEMSRIRLVWS